MPCCRPTRTLEDDNIHRWIALRRSDRSACSGRPHGWRRFPGLRRTITCPIVATGRHRHHGQLARSQGPWRSRGHSDGRSKPLYLPPYSPDFNPIEMAFSRLKALLHPAAARTMTDLWQAIANALKRFSPPQAAPQEQPVTTMRRSTRACIKSVVCLARQP
jgi:transposase